MRVGSVCKNNTVIYEEEDDENYESLGPDQRTTYEDGDLVITASSSGAGDESFEIKPDEDAPEFEIKIEDSDPKLEAEDQDSDFELEEQESDPDDDFEEEKPAVKCLTTEATMRLVNLEQMHE